MGIAVCGSGLGTLVFPAVMPYVINAPLWFDYEGALLLEATIIFICVIFGALMIPLPQELSEIRRVERKAREAAKLQVLKSGTATSQNDDQQNLLLSTNRERSHENVSETVTTNLPVVVARKDAIYQGNLHNIPLYNKNTDEYHCQMIKTSDMTNETNKKAAKKLFLTKIAEQIDLNLLKDAAFALFVISDVLTNLGFYVNRLILYNITLIISGIATMFAPFCNSFVQTHMTYAGLFGFFSGGYVGLISII
ncbi:unnamed protein product, partial [Rotaria sp. Silwood2]